MNKQENIYSLKGFDKVFKFTLAQTFKNKAYRLSLILMILLMSLMGPINYFSTQSGVKIAEKDSKIGTTSVEKVYILNETDVDYKEFDKKFIDTEDESAIKPEFFTVYQSSDMSEDELLDKIGSGDGGIIISQDETGYLIKGIISKDSTVKINDIDNLAGIVKNSFDDVRLNESDVDQTIITKISQGVSTNGVISEQGYKDEQNKTVSGGQFTTYMMGFALIILVVVSLANSFIIASVTEEKQSKLVENILVTVRPMALITGKIFGMLTYVFTILIGGFLGAKLSDFIMRDVIKLDMTYYKGAGIDFSFLSGQSIGIIIAVIAAILLGFLTFAFLGGMFGSACSKAEDIQNATGNVMIIAFLGYMGGFILGSMDKAMLSEIIALVPPFSYFTMPVLYITGRISLLVMLGSFAIQIALLLGIVLLCAKTYRVLVLSDSSTPKFRTIIKSFKA